MTPLSTPAAQGTVADAETVARKAGWYPAIGKPGKFTRASKRHQGGVFVESWEEACEYDRLPFSPASASASPEALPAEAKDDVIACLLAEKPFWFDPATNFVHADDGGGRGTRWEPATEALPVSGVEAVNELDAFYQGWLAKWREKLAALTATPALEDRTTNDAHAPDPGVRVKQLAKEIVRNVCELDDIPDPEHPDTIMVTVSDLEAVIANALESASLASDASPRGEPTDAEITTVWRAAMTVACNMVIKRQNDLNDDDGPIDVLNEQGQIIHQIKKWMEPDRVYLAELRDLLGYAHPAPATVESDALRIRLGSYAITEEYDFPGDAEEFCGYWCHECREHVEADGTGHGKDCPCHGVAPNTPRAVKERAALAPATEAAS
ncbi:zinc-ribbon domain-containing protein [Bosea sp. SSUT16]|uniref:Zinc-ribbon domain-containing protein n=1 Tax=Bosea spartocytisi TaxID=2773451 RepID=A0A927E823_9HYPH|nr:zinc-ribbon domain-containing protein [Bosea spartocytisi]MBD3845957.1 zinc-ribbon domain-containing protein [Bosea spartocytisi]MCT4473141.1 zinc-ribbon domain-containing protein [Bosea spartocytisi]